MRRRIGWLMLVGGAALLVDSGCTMTQSPKEHLHQWDLVVDTDARGLVEDLDILFQTDRPTRLTRWHER